MSRLCFDLSIKCRFSLLSFYVLSYRVYLHPLNTYKNALVLKARPEGQGTYTTCQSLCLQPRPTGSWTALHMHGRNRLSIAPCRTSNTNSPRPIELPQTTANYHKPPQNHHKPLQKLFHCTFNQFILYLLYVYDKYTTLRTL